jgi:hypothetical protein
MNKFLHKDIEGLSLAQNSHIDDVFLKLKDSYGDPVNVIELGTCYGGFALFLRKLFPESNIHTFDIADWGDYNYINHRNKLFFKYGINYYNEDYRLDNGKRVIKLLKRKSILLCDGGHKENDFRYFLNYINEGSIIMAHDYGKNREWFDENINGKYWNTSFEFDGSKFDDKCIEKGFEPYLQDDFDKAVWYIRKKL